MTPRPGYLKSSLCTYSTPQYPPLYNTQPLVMASCSTESKTAKKEKQKKTTLITSDKTQSASKVKSKDNSGSQPMKKSPSATSSSTANKLPSKKPAPPTGLSQPSKKSCSLAKSPPANKLPSKKSAPPTGFSQPSKKPCSAASSSAVTKSQYKTSAPPPCLSRSSKKPDLVAKSPAAKNSPAKKSAPPTCLPTPNDQAGRQSMPQKTDHSPKLLKRFYEPLILLHVLGKVRGGSESYEPSRSSSSAGLPTRDRRRQFLDALAFTCDYERGGDSVAAIGLESTPQCHTFWIAANTCPKKKMVPFIHTILEELRRIEICQAGLDEGTILIARQCLRFGEKRIKATFQMLQKQIERCQPLLSRSGANDDRCESSIATSSPSIPPEKLTSGELYQSTKRSHGFVDFKTKN